MKKYIIIVLLFLSLVIVSGCIDEEVELEVFAREGGATEPEEGTYNHEEGKEVVVEAIPEEGYKFQGWERTGSAEECDQYDRVCTFTIKEDSSLAAHFAEEETRPTYNLDVTVEGQGSVEIDPYEEEYEEGAEVTLEVVPEEGWVFNEWALEDVINEDDEDDQDVITLTMDSNRKVIAYFVEDVGEHELEMIDMEGGTTVPEPGTHIYEDDEEVIAEAMPDEEWQFQGWEMEGSAVECDTYNKICNFTIKEDSMLAAHFTEEEIDEYELDLGVYTNGGTTDPEPGTYIYEEGEKVTVEAIPDDGYKFQGWEMEGSTEDCAWNETICEFTIDENSLIGAHFDLEHELH